MIIGILLTRVLLLISVVPSKKKPAETSSEEPESKKAKCVLNLFPAIVFYYRIHFGRRIFLECFFHF